MTIEQATQAGDVTERTVWRGELPSLADVFRARSVIRKHFAPTPLLRSEALSDRVGCEVLVKCENMLPTGAFKVRGGLYYMSRLDEVQRARGVVGASTGNHGQSLAYAARAYGTRATVFVPEEANPLKIAAMRRLGAKVVHFGRDFDDCLLESKAYAERNDSIFIHSANEPLLVAGVATHTLEILEEEPDVDAVFVAIGGGSGLCGACLAGKGIKPGLEVVGVQSTGAPAVYEAWTSRSLVRNDSCDTFAEGIATREAFAMPAQLLWGTVDEIMLVSDADLRRAMLTLLETTRVLAEGAGAAGLAGLYERRSAYAGRKVAAIVSGGNLTLDGLADAMDKERAW
ncbi:MAG: threonine/serine dehydratase [Chloroflexota bacterium]|nr:threonine/serine dehydratase [Chloroflexota bacterium]